MAGRPGRRRTPYGHGPAEIDVDPDLVDYLCRLFCHELDGERGKFGGSQAPYRHLPDNERAAMHAAMTTIAQAVIAETTG